MRVFFGDHTLELAIIDRNHPMRDEVEHYVAQRYSLAFDAHLNGFMPTFTALMDGGHIKSLCGYRVASEEALFLEQYLNYPADVLLAEAFHCPIDRALLIEFGQLASFSKGFSSRHFLLMTQQLVAQGYEWCIFTATDPLYAMMCRLGLEPTILAEADPTRIPDARSIWGSYYQYQPRIVAGNLKRALVHLQALFAGGKQRLTGGF